VVFVELTSKIAHGRAAGVPQTSEALRSPIEALNCAVSAAVVEPLFPTSPSQMFPYPS
jgi:hypothetical protein